jgi:hypothetical protein
MGQMVYVEAPSSEVKRGYPSIFLAGGITGCSDWQAEATSMLGELVAVKQSANQFLNVLNPRRANFPINDPNAALAQIQWEFKMLRQANVILFWFDADQIQPIVLFELGSHSMRLKQNRYSFFDGIVIGIHRDYPRKQDVEIQMSLLFGLDEMPIYPTLVDTTYAAFCKIKGETWL